MEIINNPKASLGLELFDELGFSSEEELKREILKLIKVRNEFESSAFEVKFKVNAI